MRSIAVPQIKIEKDVLCLLPSEIAKDAYDEISRRRLLMWLLQKIATISNQYVGYPNNEQTRDEIKFAILSLFGNVIDNLHCYRDDLDVIVKNGDVDELAEKCNSYEEYKMKHAIISGDLPVISESEFWKRHDPDNKYTLDINVQLKPPEEILYINFNYELSTEESL